MAVGRAVVASGIGQNAELLCDSQTGLLVAPGDVEALAGAIRRLADDPDLRKTLGRRAAAEARSTHTWTQRAQRIVGLAEAMA